MPSPPPVTVLHLAEKVSAKQEEIITRLLLARAVLTSELNRVDIQCMNLHRR